MDFAERVRFCRAELEKARHDFPAASSEVQTAENLYGRALNDATCGGSPAVTGSDLSLTADSKIHVAFYCDKVNVTAVFSIVAALVSSKHSMISLPPASITATEMVAWCNNRFRSKPPVSEHRLCRRNSRT